MYKITGTLSRFFLLFALFLGISHDVLAQNNFASPFDLGVLGIGSPYNSVGNNETANGFSDSYTGTNNQASNDVFYKITTGHCTDKVVISTCSASTSIDTHIHFLDNAGTHIASNDDSGCALAAGASELSMTGLLPNTVYYIVVESLAGTEGVFDLTIEEFDAVPFTIVAAAPEVCLGSAANLTATPTNGVVPITYAWTPITAGRAGLTGSPANIAITIATDGDGYEVVATDVNMCSATDFTFLTVNAPPSVTASGSTSLCASATTVSIGAIFGGSATMGTWSFSNPGGGTLTTTSIDGSIESYTLAGTDFVGPYPKNIVFTITTDAPSGCVAATDMVTITITGNPDLITTPPAAFCAGGSTDLAATVTDNNSTTGTTTWYAEQLDADTEVNALTSTTVSPAATHTYWVRKNVDVSGCFDIASVVVTVNQLPTITLSAVANVCSNASSFALPYTATTDAPNQYSITTGATALAGFVPVTLATLGASPLTIAIPSGSTPGTYDFNMVVNNTTTGCISAVVPFTVTIDAAPTATVSYATPYCSTDATGTPLVSGAAGTYSSTAGLSINSATGVIDITTSTAGSYVVTYTIPAAAPCAPVLITTPVVINTLPVPTLTYATPVCLTGGDQTPTSFTPAGGAFTIDGGGTIAAGTGVIAIPTTTAGAYTVTYTIAAAGGCAATSSNAPITITTPPTASIAYAGTPFCKTGTGAVTFTGTGTGGAYTGDAGLVVNGTTGLIDLAASTAGAHTVTYTLIGTGGCPDVVATTNIMIDALPTATIAYSAAAFCTATLPASLTAAVTRTGTAGGTYTASPAGLTIDGTTGALTFATSTAGAYTVTYTFTDAITGCTNTATTAVTINAQPTPTIVSSTGNFTPCVTDGVTTSSITLSTNPTFVTYAWTGSLGTGGNAANPTIPTVNQSVPNPVQPYTVTVTDANGCKASTNVNVTYQARPAATVTASPNSICQGQSTTVTATLAPGTTFDLTWSDGLVQTAQTSPVIRTLSPVANTTYSVTTLTNGTCPAAASGLTSAATVNVSPAAAAPTVVPNPVEVCIGSPFTITPTATPVPTPQAFTSTYDFNAPLVANVGTLVATVAGAGLAGVNGIDLTTVGTISTTSTQGGACGAQTTDWVSGTGASSPYAYSQAAWSVGDYYEARVTAKPNYKLGATAFSFKVRRSSTGPGQVNVGYTVDGGALQPIILGQAVSSTGFSIYSFTLATPITNATDIRFRVIANVASTGGTPLCSTMRIDDIVITGTSIATPSFVYYSDAALTTQIGTGNSYTTTASGSTPANIYVTDISGACPSAAAIVPVTVNELPTLTIGTIASVCNSATAFSLPYNATVGNPDKYSITAVAPSALAGFVAVTNAALTASPLSIAIPSGSLAGTYNFNMTVSNSVTGCTPAVLPFTLTIDNLGTASIVYTGTPFCTTTATATPAFTGTATGGTYTSAAALSMDGTSGVIDIAASTPGSYTVTYTLPANGSCPAVVATAPITITALPVPTLTYASPVCLSSGDQTPTAFTPAGGAFTIDNGGTIDAGTGVVTAAVANYTVTYTIAAAGGCAATSSTAAVNIVATPTATIAYTGSPFCSSAGPASPTFTGTATGGTYSSAAGLTIDGTTGVIDIATSTPATYTVAYDVAAGTCPAVHETTTIEINTSVAPAFATGVPVAACEGAPIATLVATLTASPSPAPTYVWTVPATAVNGVPNDEEFDILPVAASEAGTYTVVATNVCGSATATIVFTVNAVPVITNVAFVCAGVTATVEPATPATYTYNLIAQTGGTPPATFPFVQNNNPTFTLGAGTVDAEFTITSGACTSLPYSADFSGCPGGALPVKLSYFKGTIVAKDNQLEWGTATEQNSAWFIVEASNDGLLFKEVGRKRAAGNSSTPLTYAFTHSDVPTSMYYRLRMMDADGSFEYSNTVYLRRNKGSLAVNNVFPNPTEGMITVQYEVEKPSQLKFTITDELGRRLSTKSVEAVSGVNNQNLDLADFPGGVYFLLIDEADGKRTVRRVIKN